MIKNLYSCFCTKIKYPFVLNYNGVGEVVCVCKEGRERGW